MCLALYKPVGVTVDETALEVGFENNSDGAGYTIRDDAGELQTFKGFFKFKDFIEHWRQHATHEATIHFRWMTSGKRDKDNCHPFRFGAKKAWSVIHNGVLSGRTTATMSDTACFTEDVLHELAVRDMMHYPDVIEQLEEEIGAGNKMVIMPPVGAQAKDVIILNEDKGFWEKGVWWSNESWKRTVYRYQSTTGSYGSTSSTFSGHNWWDIDDAEYAEWERLNGQAGSTAVVERASGSRDEDERYLEYLEAKWREGLTEAESDATVSQYE